MQNAGSSFATPTPTPIVIPKEAYSNPQVLHIFQQLQHHSLPFYNIIVGYKVFTLPFLSLSQKLAIYYFLIGLPLKHLPPLVILALLYLWPIFFIIALVLGYLIITKILLQRVIPLIFRIIGKSQLIENKVFLELTFPSDTTKSAYATEELYNLLHVLARQKGILGRFSHHKTLYSLELVASRDEGIRYVIAVPSKFKEIVHEQLISFLQGIKIKEIKDYLPDFIDLSQKQNISKNDDSDEEEEYEYYTDNEEDKTNFKSFTLPNGLHANVLEFRLSNHFALPLKTQKTLTEHDPISYITGAMTKLLDKELISLQIIATPVMRGSHHKVLGKAQKLRNNLMLGKPILPLVARSRVTDITSNSFISITLLLFKITWNIGKFVVVFVYSMAAAAIDTSGKTAPFLQDNSKEKREEDRRQIETNPYEIKLREDVMLKIDGPMYETTIRVLIATSDKYELYRRTSSLRAQLGLFTTQYQSFVERGTFLGFDRTKARLAQFEQRTLSSGDNPVLSSSELSDIYHFPFTDITKTQGLLKTKDNNLPVPTRIKKADANLETFIGVNTYGGEITPIGITKKQKRSHSYLIGKTGMGKSTMIKTMAYQDILKGYGVAVFDPHGDMITELLEIIPKKRLKDVVYVNFADKEYPVGINVFRSNTLFSDIEEEHTFLARSVISIFQKITPKEHWGQRMEHILRNASLTALQIPTPSKETAYISLYTIQKILTDREYLRSILPYIYDPILKEYWVNEFNLFGKMQKASAISPLTNKLGEFITDYTSRYILLQKDSTIDISDIMDNSKILLINLSKGKLGEERSAFFGTLLTSLIQMGTYARQNILEEKRKDFFVYIDEFQNFATPNFLDLFSEARKYRVFFIPSHQSVVQLEDIKMPKIISLNSGNLIVFKSGPDDEAFLLPFLEPEVKKGNIVNLPVHHFYVKSQNTDNDSEEDNAFSGVTTPLENKGSKLQAKKLIEYSRKHYAITREEAEKQLEQLLNAKIQKPAKQNSNLTIDNSKSIKTTPGKKSKTAKPRKNNPSKKVKI